MTETDREHPTRTYTRQKIIAYMEQLEEPFDVVRLVNPVNLHCLHFDGDPGLETSPEICSTLWNRDGRCVNCISARAISERKRQTIIELKDGQPYFVMADPVEIEGTVCSLECAVKMCGSNLYAMDSKEFSKELKRVNDKIYKDSLTKVYNRRYYDEIARGMYCTALAFLDVNHFKNVNDKYGHEIGDRLLEQIAETIRDNIRATDALIRYGGDEFVLFFDDEFDYSTLVGKLEGIRNQIAEIQIPGMEESISISIGAVLGFETVMNLLTPADEQMYRAKKVPGHICVEKQAEQGHLDL